MTRLSKSLRFQILARDGFKCRYCGRSAPNVELHIDHILPTAKGGLDIEANLAAACADCNHGKSDRALVPNGDGFNLTKDHRPARLSRARYSKKREEMANPSRHVLNTGVVDSLDEIDDDRQLALVWCVTHQAFEWHYIPQHMIGHTAELVRITKPGWTGRI